jgi:hypothetical protein
MNVNSLGWETSNFFSSGRKILKLKVPAFNNYFDIGASAFSTNFLSFFSPMIIRKNKGFCEQQYYNNVAM